VPDLIKKVVITAAGLGTRLLPMSKELPKEMMPLFLKGRNGLVLKPALQAIFEQLYSFGFRDFCFVVGRGKRAIVDHFTPDWRYVDLLIEACKTAPANNLKSFYEMVENSKIIWINQPQPKGFGHAVSMAEAFVNKEPFLVAAGDTFIVSNNFLVRMVNAYSTRRPSAVLLLMKIHDPRDFGVAVIDKERVIRVVEKPSVPPSNLAIMPFYIFDPTIFKILPEVKPGFSGEIQLTDAIQKLVEKKVVYFVLLNDGDLRLDIGTPETYWDAIKSSYEWSRGGQNATR
jgi:UTP--glucose-1-phosphate uridylyltransferase